MVDSRMLKPLRITPDSSRVISFRILFIRRIFFFLTLFILAFAFNIFIVLVVTFVVIIVGFLDGIGDFLSHFYGSFTFVSFFCCWCGLIAAGTGFSLFSVKQGWNFLNLGGLVLGRIVIFVAKPKRFLSWVLDIVSSQMNNSGSRSFEDDFIARIKVEVQSLV